MTPYHEGATLPPASDSPKQFRKFVPSQRLTFWLMTVLAVALTASVYLPGLRGVFLFDDFANLPSLGAFGPVDNWTAFWRYVTSGIADPTGRPLALVSFLIDAHDWPADPFPFKRTNLILHLCNGVLLAMLLRRLGRTLHPTGTRRSDAAAVLAAALWMLHPLLVSTTLYVVQREAMLPAAFTLLGLLGYCRGRTAAASGNPRGIWLAAGSIVLATLLGVASKANGALLPLLAWLLEALLLAPAQPIPDSLLRRFSWMRRIVLQLPGALLLLWLAMQGMHFILHGTPSFRTWSITERLMTEARIVCEYLSLLWLPHPYTAGLFNDAVTVSTGLLSPPSTLASIGFLGALLAAAIFLRRRLPVAATSVLFYFTGQLLESTVIPLELYYEHRNYLPAMLMFWPLALWLLGDGHAVIARRMLAVFLPLLLAGMTFLNADLWGDAQQQALVWAEKNPQSPRAQAYAAAAERARGRPDLAAQRAQKARVLQTEDIQVALNLVGAQCEMGRVDAAALERAKTALRTTRTAGRLYFDWMSEAIRRATKGKACKGLEIPEILQLLEAMAENPRMRSQSGWQQDNLGLRALLALEQGDAKSALEYYNQALDVYPGPAAALAQAAALGSAGYPQEGLAHLDHFASLPVQKAEFSWSMPGIHAWLLRRQGFMQEEIAHLREVLEQDVRDAKANAR